MKKVLGLFMILFLLTGCAAIGSAIGKGINKMAPSKTEVVQVVDPTTGEITNEAVLSQIFSKFCIGK